MLPNVVEYDEKMTDKRREDIYYGLWIFLSKFIGAQSGSTGGVLNVMVGAQKVAKQILKEQGMTGVGTASTHVQVMESR